METLVTLEPTIEYRQVGVVDARGGSAVFSGLHVLGTSAQRREENLFAIGNLLANDKVIDSMIEGFKRSSRDDLAGRLIDGLTMGLVEGGEVGPVHSAGVLVTSPLGWAETDLRVDYATNPIDELRRLWEIWSPQRHDYMTRGDDPSSAPPYGVPGEQ